MLQRKQFTFYRSFFEAISVIKVKARRAELYDIVCDYALNGVLPEMEQLTDIQKSSLRLIMPVLDTARQKAEAGKTGGSKTKANRKQTESKKETENESETETETEYEYESEGAASAAADIDRFEIFWNEYPRKIGKDKARLIFERIETPLQTLLQAVKQHKQSAQWNQSNGLFVPNPATWLEERRWEDELPMLSGSSIQASGVMGDAEREAVRRMLAEG